MVKDGIGATSLLAGAPAGAEAEAMVNENADFVDLDRAAAL
jgi:hypothetical protein